MATNSSALEQARARLRRRKNELDSKINEVNAKINQLKSKRDSYKKYINQCSKLVSGVSGRNFPKMQDSRSTYKKGLVKKDANSQISSAEAVNGDLSSLQKTINNNKSIAEKELKKIEKKIKDKEKDLKKLKTERKNIEETLRHS